MKHLFLILICATAFSCGDAGGCVSPDLSGGWTESDRSALSLTQSCDGQVTGRWTTRTAAGVVAAEWNVAGNVSGTRFLWNGICANQMCTNDVINADGTEGSGMNIVDNGNRIDGSFSVPGRALASFMFTRDM